MRSSEVENIMGQRARAHGAAYATHKCRVTTLSASWMNRKHRAWFPQAQAHAANLPALRCLQPTSRET